MPEVRARSDGVLTPEDQLLHDEVQRRLEQRPRLTLRLRIALVFTICTLFIGGVTIGSILMLSHVRARTQFLQAMDGLALASRVRAALAANEKTASVEVAVRADDGVISLRGKVRPEALVESVIRVAGDVEGVDEVYRRDLEAPDYTV